MLMIGVATYRRPALLAKLLDSLRTATGSEEVRVVVVDNDPRGSARQVVERSGLRATYVLEPRPGIAAARNRSLSMLSEGDEAIIFVDDDEHVSPGWLAELRQAQTRYDADIVTGPVISTVQGASGPRVRAKLTFMQRPTFATGPVDVVPATNNTLVATRVLREAAWPQFDEAFSVTGGEDTAFFVSLIAGTGATVVWAADALVHEDVPSDRLTWRWILRRGVRGGNVLARIHLRTVSRARVCALGVARVVVGSAGLATTAASGAGAKRAHLIRLLHGIGYLQAAAGRTGAEYRRPASSG